MKTKVQEPSLSHLVHAPSLCSMSNSGHFFCDEIKSGPASLVKMVAPDTNSSYLSLENATELKKRKIKYYQEVTAWA